MKLKSILLGAAMAAASASASALTVVAANVPQVGTSNLFRDPCGLSAGSATGSPVLGCLSAFPSQTISVSSDESLTITGGQAILDSADGLFSQLTISATAPASLSTVIFNIDAEVDGFITFADGSGTSSPFALDDNGLNFFTLTGIAGNFLTAVSYIQLTEADIIANVAQIRIGVDGAIPEPGTYSLMMAGLAAFGLFSRRRKAKK